jgi:hypothetical protein
MEEIWKEIEGYENYEVSNMGRVRSIDRTIYQEGFGERRLKGRLVKPWHNGYGYYKVSLGSYAAPDGKRKHPTEFVHRLVAEAFIPNPDNLPQVNHIDYDRKNNKMTNLEWCTAKGNMEHSHDRLFNHKNICRSNTGYKYICNKRRRFEVCVIDRGKKYCRSFKKLEDAVTYRNQITKELGIEYKDNTNRIP